MTHPTKKIVIVHSDAQRTFEPDGTVVADETWAAESHGAGYDPVTDRLALLRPQTDPPGMRTVDVDSLAELAATTYAGWNSVQSADARGGKVLAVIGVDGEFASYHVVVIDPTDLSILWDSGPLATSTFGVVSNTPKCALLSVDGDNVPTYAVTRTGTSGGVVILTGTTVEETITSPDGTRTWAAHVAADDLGRLAITWRDLNQNQTTIGDLVVSYAADRSTILGQHLIKSGSLVRQARAFGAVCFDPATEHVWYYSGYWFDGPSSEPSPSRRNYVYKVPIGGTATITAEEFQTGMAAVVIDGGGDILVPGPAFSVPTVRATGSRVRQRQRDR